MTRAEHNECFGTDLRPEDPIAGGVAEYDFRCIKCHLHHPHCWLEHDRLVLRTRAGDTLEARLAL